MSALANSATDREALLPCPFCGGEWALGQEPHDNYPVNSMWYLYHKSPRCFWDWSPPHFDTSQQAIAAWNRRATPSAEAIREACAAVCDDVEKAYATEQAAIELSGGTASYIERGRIVSRYIGLRIRALDLTRLPAGNDAGVGEVARPMSEWHEDMGDVVWWKFPITEPAFIGSPIDSAWPGYHTHFTPHPALPVPA